MPRWFEEERTVGLHLSLAQVVDRDTLLARLGSHNQPLVQKILDIDRKSGGIAFHR